MPAGTGAQAACSALMRALRRLLWRAAVVLWIRPRAVNRSRHRRDPGKAGGAAAGAESAEVRVGAGEGGLGGGGVVGLDRRQHLLDGGAQHRTLGGVAGVAHDGLLGALLGGLDVGHGRSWKLVR